MEQSLKLLDILFYNTGSITAILEGISEVTKLKSNGQNLSYNIGFGPKQLRVFKENFSQLTYPIGKILEQIDSRRIIIKTSWIKLKEFNRFFDFSDLLSRPFTHHWRCRIRDNSINQQKI